MVKIPFQREASKHGRLAMYGLAGVCVICVTQILELATLGLPLKLALGGFAIALPMLTVAGLRHEALLERSGIDSYSGLILAGVGGFGCIWALWGLTFVFWHFHWVFAVLFLMSIAASGFCMFCFLIDDKKRPKV